MNEQAQAKPVRLAALGDSLTAGWMLREQDAFPVVLQRELKALGHEVEIINFGVSGDTTGGGLARLSPVIGCQPDGVILELGTNDSLMGLDPAEIEANLEAIISACERKGIPVVLTGVRTVPGMDPVYGTECAAAFERLAVRHKLLFYPFFLEGVVGQRSLCLPDGLHPNAEGARQITMRFLPTAVAFLNEIATRKGAGTSRDAHAARPNASRTTP